MTKHLLILLAAAAFAAGCGGSSSYGTEPTTETTKPAAAKTAAKTVKMAGSTFAPAALDIKVGETITFVNDDEIAHTATSDAFDSKTIEPGASFSYTADKAGAISYVCTFHPGMTGTINVT